MTNSAMEFVPTAVGATAVCGYLLNALKAWSRATWITHHSIYINATLRALFSLTATIGIGFVWNGTEHTLTINGLNALVIMTSLWHWFVTYAMANGWEKVFLIGVPVAYRAGDTQK